MAHTDCTNCGCKTPCKNPESHLKYSYNEDELIKEIKEYIRKTYNEHYSQGKYQATDTIIDAGYGEGFLMGNIIKYAKRFGKKDGRNRRDILKIIHYAIIMLHSLDGNKEQEQETYITTNVSIGLNSPYIWGTGNIVRGIL